MINVLLDAFFGWLKRPPLLWDFTDFIMFLCCITLLVLAISELIKKKKHKYFVSYTYNVNEFAVFEFTTNFKVQDLNSIIEMQKAIEKKTGRNKVTILFITEFF